MQAAQQDLFAEKNLLLLCLLAGASNAAFLVGWMLAIQKNAMVTVDVALTMGSLIPAALCAWLFGEPLSLRKMLGFALILAAAVTLSGYRRDPRGKSGAVGLALLVFAAVGDGLSGFCQQIYNQYYTETGARAHGVFYSNSVYQFYTFVFSALILLCVFLLYVRRRGRFSKRLLRPLAKPLPHIFVAAVCLFVVNYLQTMITGAYGMPSQILYPVLRGGSLITVNLTATLFFGEKPTVRSVVGSLTALVGIVFMNIL